MTNNRRFLYDLSLTEEIAHSDDTEIIRMSSVEIAAQLEDAGLNAAKLVDRVRTNTDAMRRNAMIAKRMHIEKADVQRRAILLAFMACVGLGATVFALIGASLAPESTSEAARKLFVLVFVGGIGLLLTSLLAILYVLWNAYVHKAILAEVASEETNELVSTIDQIRATRPAISVTQLVVLLRQNPIWERHHTTRIT
jgi:hypothetical protein